MRALLARAAGLLAAAVLLAGCGQDGESALACKVDVAAPDLVADRVAAGIADCTEVETADGSAEGAADLPAVPLDCLGEQGTVRLDAVKGPAMINFWASNCGPCRKELPALQQFHEEYGDQVAVVGVDYLDTYPGAAIDLARRSGVTYPSLADACGDLADSSLVIRGLPQFVFVAADGSISQAAGGVDSVADLVELAEDHLGIGLAQPKGAEQ